MNEEKIKELKVEMFDLSEEQGKHKLAIQGIQEQIQGKAVELDKLRNGNADND